MDERLLIPGTIVKHFKRDLSDNSTNTNYLYVIEAVAKHTETGERLVIYTALYDSDELGVHYDTFARPYDMFMRKVNTDKYPNAKQTYVFEELAHSDNLFKIY